MHFLFIIEGFLCKILIEKCEANRSLMMSLTMKMTIAISVPLWRAGG